MTQRGNQRILFQKRARNALQRAVRELQAMRYKQTIFILHLMEDLNPVVRKAPAEYHMYTSDQDASSWGSSAL